jgi:hypothetical protein
MTNTYLLHLSLFFHSRSSGIATGIGSLAPGLDGHELGLGRGTEGLPKTWGSGAPTFL